MATGVRRAAAADLEALVELRLENARVHVGLDPAAYRVPDAAAVRAYFSDLLAQASGTSPVWVAAGAGSPLGMAELVLDSLPPDHQILQPVATAHVHVVVRPAVRREGVGRSLLAAAEDWATRAGIGLLAAGIHPANAVGLAFYAGAGYRESGRIATKLLGAP